MSEQPTTDVGRLLRQSLESWRQAGVTQLPRCTPAPTGSASAAAPPADALPVDRRRTVLPAVTRETPPDDVRRADDLAPRRQPTTPEPPPLDTAASLSSTVDDMPGNSREQQLSDLATTVTRCVRCRELASTRTQTVFGVGNPRAQVMFIGEAPGADEDAQGEPFVGRAGQLLNRIIVACGWKREDLYICNILRCRPPGNRNPLPEEAANCREYLDGQIAIVSPEYIVCWGSIAATNLLSVTDPIGRLRGRFFSYGRAKVLCTYHPSYLLRNPAAKKPVWEDMQLLLKEMGLTPPQASAAP